MINNLVNQTFHSTKINQVTYKKVLRILASAEPNGYRGIKCVPKSINMDFERAIMNSFTYFWPNIQLRLCYFHLSQSWFRRIQKCKLFTQFVSKKEFHHIFKMCQALAYLPIDKVVDGFEIIKEKCPIYGLKFINYIQRNYIGCNGKPPHFAIKFWNIRERVLNNDQTTNNKQEQWHGAITLETRRKLTVGMTIELFRNEQANMEKQLSRVLSGEILTKKPPKLQRNKDEQIKNLVCSEISDLGDYLSRLGSLLDIKIKNDSILKQINNKSFYIINSMK